jgi:hypothetical protein
MKGEHTMNMTIEQAIATLEIAHGQQMSDEVEQAIRTVLDGMKQRVEVVRCHECKHRHTNDCSMTWLDEEKAKLYDWSGGNDFCYCGTRK